MKNDGILVLKEAAATTAAKKKKKKTRFDSLNFCSNLSVWIAVFR